MSNARVLHSYYNEIAGLTEGNSVTIKGYKIGTITNVSFDNERNNELRVEMNIEDDIQIPLNTVAKITNTDNGKSLILRITDRGPFVKGRILDCSMGAAKKLDFYTSGTANVKIDIIELGDNEYMHHD